MICGERQMRIFFPPPVWAGLHFRDGLELNLSELGRCGVIWSDMGRWQSWPACSIVAVMPLFNIHWNIEVTFSQVYTASLEVCCSYLLKFVWEALTLTRRRWSVMNIQMFMTQLSLRAGWWCVCPLSSESACGTESWRISTYQKYQNLDKKIGG